MDFEEFFRELTGQLRPFAEQVYNGLKDRDAELRKGALINQHRSFYSSLDHEALLYLKVRDESYGGDWEKFVQVALQKKLEDILGQETEAMESVKQMKEGTLRGGILPRVQAMAYYEKMYSISLSTVPALFEEYLKRVHLVTPEKNEHGTTQ